MKLLIKNKQENNVKYNIFLTYIMLQLRVVIRMKLVMRAVKIP
jgi:hypothetical protein